MLWRLIRVSASDEHGGAWWERCPIDLRFARMACDLAAWNGRTEVVVLLLDSLPKHPGMHSFPLSCVMCRVSCVVLCRVSCRVVSLVVCIETWN